MTSDICVVRSPLFLQHLCPEPHVENPGRLAGILELFEERPVLATIPTLAPVRIHESILHRIHSEPVCAALLDLEGKEGWIDSDTYYGKKSLTAALAAAGSCVELALAIWKGNYRRGFSLVRPPGHHATLNRAMGFCL